MTERLLVAVLVGLVNASLVYVASDILDAPRLWPGTVLAFASTTLTTLLFLRARRGGR